MDWMSLVDAVIICSDEIVQVPLSNGEIFGILGEQLEASKERVMSIGCDEVSASGVLSYVTFRMFS
jgi:hypothetical protein